MIATVDRRMKSVLLLALLSLSACATAMKDGGSPTMLFDRHDLDQWVAADGSPPQWEVVEGAMIVNPGTGSIVTRRSYRDFVLHVEFNVPEAPPEARGQSRGNSGVYLQRRYEVQILDSYGLEAGKRDCGALYNFKAPDENASRPAGQWQKYDITFRSPRWEKRGNDLVKLQNARITVIHNGITIHDDVGLENKTGQGQPEGPEPGPILLQDHGHRVRFRNIWIKEIEQD